MHGVCIVVSRPQLNKFLWLVAPKKDSSPWLAATSGEMTMERQMGGRRVRYEPYTDMLYSPKSIGQWE
jgi:hypothetical protein